MSTKHPTLVRVPSIVAGTLLSVIPLAASSHAIQLENQVADVRAYLESAPSNKRNRRRQRFLALANKWREDTKWLSSTNEIAMHPAYQAIIGMGQEAIPMILEDLRKNSGHWYWALKAIAQEDPVHRSERGSINRMKQAWLRWAEQKGILNDVVG